MLGDLIQVASRGRGPRTGSATIPSHDVRCSTARDQVVALPARKSRYQPRST